MGDSKDGDSYISPSNTRSRRIEDTSSSEDPNQAGLDSFDNEENLSVEGNEDSTPDNEASGPGGAVGGGGTGSKGAVIIDEPSEEEDESREPERPDEEEPQVVVILKTDPWDNMGWGVEPILKQIQEEYGDQVVIHYDIVRVRKFEDPNEMAKKWKSNANRHGMPVNPEVWYSNPPESTELANRAVKAAKEQGLELAYAYLRRLRIAAIVEGINIEDPDVLFELAADVGLDSDQFTVDWEAIEVRRTTTKPSIPETIIHIDDLRMVFEQVGLEEKTPRPLAEFVGRYGPVTTKEVMQVYGFVSRDKATTRLREVDGVHPMEYGDETFWITQTSST